MKIKNYRTAEYVVGGWLPTKAGGLESLLVGNYDTAGNLIFAGNVDFGLTGKRAQILPMLELLTTATCPFFGLKLPRGVWVQPKLSARVKSIGLNRGVLREGTLIELALV